jgi:DNA polymerase III subunit delta'
MSALIGHEHIQDLLKRTVAGGRPSHAYLFAGREGVGKRLVAIRFASMLNCSSQKVDPECDCRMCRRIRDGKSPDVLVERPERGMIRIDRVRNLQRFFRYPPIESRFRVVVIDDAHTMNHQAQNALLKILEEPPPGRTLILVSSKPALLLSTVRSRCRKIVFGPLPLGPLTDMVSRQTGFSTDKSRVPASLAGGSAGKALELAGSKYMELREDMLSMLTHPGKRGVRGLLDLSVRISADREKASEAIEIATTLVRDMLVMQSGGDASTAVNSDSLDIIASSAQHYTQDDLFAVYEELANAAELVDSDIHVNRNLVMDVALLKITRILAGPSYGITAGGITGEHRYG